MHSDQAWTCLGAKMCRSSQLFACNILLPVQMSRNENVVQCGACECIYMHTTPSSTNNFIMSPAAARDRSLLRRRDPSSWVLWRVLERWPALLLTGLVPSCQLGPNPWLYHLLAVYLLELFAEAFTISTCFDVQMRCPARRGQFCSRALECVHEFTISLSKGKRKLRMVEGGVRKQLT